MLDERGLHLRAAFFQKIRSFFYNRNFLEVDTPIRQPLIIPEHNIEPLPSLSSFLQSSPELYMKRLLARGHERIFQICRCFRKGERGHLHLEEFVMLEWYRLDADYQVLMDDCEELFAALAVHGDFSFPVAIDYPWERISVEDAFQRYGKTAVQQALGDDTFDLLLVEKIEPFLGMNTPTFLYDYPIELASLARPRPGAPHLAERFELYMEGIELANGFSELTDSESQRHRFLEEYEKIGGNGKGLRTMPEKFLRDLVDIDKAAGIAMGLDRLFMLLLGETDITRAVPFAPDDLDY